MAEKPPEDAPRRAADFVAAHRFKPGQSGNPGGRPKGRSLTSILREALESDTLGGKALPGGKTVGEMLVDVMIREGLKGKFPFAREIMERADGKVPDKIDLTTNGQSSAAELARLDADDLNTLESIARKLAGRPGPAPEPGPGGEVP